MAADGKCKKHPDKKAVLRSDGISTGKCKECLAAHGAKMHGK